VQSWSKIAPKVRALSDRKFERRKDLVALLHESESNVSNWLSGSRTPQLDTAFRLVEAVGGEGRIEERPLP
jgi:transcriptional regulator with XRE-family HTH domain